MKSHIIFFVVIFTLTLTFLFADGEKGEEFDIRTVYDTSTDKRVGMIGVTPLIFRRTRKGIRRNRLNEIRKGDKNKDIPSFFVYNFEKICPVQNQGDCDSCWAISITSFLTDRIRLHYPSSRNVILPYDNLMRAFAEDGGCNGADTLGALKFIEQTSFPLDDSFTVEKGSVKQFTEFIPLENYSQEILNKNILEMKKTLLHEGPFISRINIYKDFPTLHFYRPYITSNKEFLQVHGIVVVGYCNPGVDPRSDFDKGYWICRNSWGNDWPKGNPPYPGYFSIPMGLNECGIESICYTANTANTKGSKDKYEINIPDEFYFDNFTEYSDKFLS